MFSRIFLILVCCLLPLAAFAEKAPDVLIREVVNQIKESGDPAIIVNHVDWPEAFKSMPEQDRYQLKITTADEMKTFFQDMLSSPSNTMRKNMLERVSALPADKQDEARIAIEKMSDQMVAKEAEMKQRIRDTEYTVGDAKIQGDKATVVVTQIYKGEKKAEKIDLRKKNGEWLLPTMKFGSMGK